jgi:FkbM family methyltransferase
MLDFITEKRSCWEKLALETRPIFIYGMGDGAEKILTAFSRFNIRAEGVFASDDFVRGHYFAGFKVMKYSEVELKYGDFVIVLAFGSSDEEIIERVRKMSQQHTLYIPDVPVVGSGLFTYDYCLENAEKIQAVYDMLEDEYSRKVYAAIINFKISGNMKYIDEAATSKAEIYREIIKPNLYESYVDLGAYNGDTVKEMLSLTKDRYVSIYAVEPDRKNFRKLCRSTEDKKHIKAYNAVSWCCDTQIPFSTKAGRQSSVSSSGEPIDAKSVDSILEGSQATLIKMDVEGCEREAIWGSVRTIKRYKPRLMIALYHRNEDIFELPLLVKKLNPGYKCYIRHQTYIPAWETNLYAVDE